MRTISDCYTTIEAPNSYFVGANTPKGFIGDYNRLFSEDDFKKVYIIKGGSGTGKSTIMKRAAHKADLHGITCTYLYCGSDPESLDGVIFENGDIKIALIDGTAPHTLDPVYAGACGEIVNCGDFWNSELLEDQKEIISEIVRDKKYAFEVAYRFLSAASEICETENEIAERALRREKMEAFCNRYVQALPKCVIGKGTAKLRRTLALSMRGAVRLSTFDSADTIDSVLDCINLHPIFMEAMSTALVREGYDILISPSPIYGIGEIFIPSCKRAITFAAKNHMGRNINLRRFIDVDRITAVSARRRFFEKCRCSMIDASIESLEEARKLHFKLEDIYKKTMDFEDLGSMTEKLSDKICSYFNN